MKKASFSFLFFLLFFSSVLSARQKIGSVIFSWNRAGEVSLTLSYKGEQFYPCMGIHLSDGGYSEKKAKTQQSKIIKSGKGFVGVYYRIIGIRCFWWESFKSFFIKSPRVGYHTFFLFDDGYQEFHGTGGRSGTFFAKGASELLQQFKTLQALRFS